MCWFPARKAAIILLAGMLVGGCSGNGMQQVTGTVLMDDAPLAGAAVTLIPEEGGRPTSGQTDENGTFTLASFTSNDGLPPGKYKVTIVKVDPESIPDTPARPNGEGNTTRPIRQEVSSHIKYLTPRKYFSPATTDLEVEISSGMQPLVLKIQSN